MTEPAYSIRYSATLDSAEESVEIGDVVVLNEGGDGFLVATSSNLTATGRVPTGVALSAGDQLTAFEIQQVGMVHASVTGLGAGTATNVICSSSGRLERKDSPTGSDQIMGRCDEDGTAYVGGRLSVVSGSFPSGTGVVTVTAGIPDALATSPLTTANGGTGSTTLTFPAGSQTIVGRSSTDTLTNKTISGASNTISNVSLTSGVTGTLPVANGGTGVTSIGGAFVGTTASQTLTNKTISGASNTISNVSLTAGVTGVLPQVNGGVETDLTAINGLLKNSSGTLSGVTAPSGAIVGTSDSQTLTNKTINGASNTLTVRLTNDLSGASDVTGILPQAHGGAGSDISAVSGLLKNTAGTISGVAAPSGAVVGASDSQVLTNKTISGSNNTITNVSLTSGVTGTLPEGNGGTGITALGTGVATFLGTPSSANLAAAVTGETGSGALVFGTSPALSNPSLSTPALSGTITHALPPYLFIRQQLDTVNTSNTSATTLATYTVNPTRMCAFEVYVTAVSLSALKAGRWRRAAVYVRLAAPPALVGSVETLGTDQETVSGDDVTINVSSNDVRVRVTAGDSEQRTWNSLLVIHESVYI